MGRVENVQHADLCVQANVKIRWRIQVGNSVFFNSPQDGSVWFLLRKGSRATLWKNSSSRQWSHKTGQWVPTSDISVSPLLGKTLSFLFTKQTCPTFLPSKDRTRSALAPWARTSQALSTAVFPGLEATHVTVLEILAVIIKGWGKLWGSPENHLLPQYPLGVALVSIWPGVLLCTEFTQF